jgi:hypothetical protein
MLAQTISAPAISFFIFTPIPLTLCGIAAAPIAEDQARKCELAHISIRLSKKQQLTRLFCETDARSGLRRLINRGGCYMMLSGNRPWLEYDSVALVVLFVGIGFVALIVLGI